jgi:hypothetical protein
VNREIIAAQLGIGVAGVYRAVAAARLTCFLPAANPEGTKIQT